MSAMDWKALEPAAAREAEFAIKLARVRQFLAEKDLGGLLLSRIDNFAWITCGGDSYVPINSEGGVASFLITQDNQYLVTNNIELPRITDEELGSLPCEKLTGYWFEDEPIQQIKQLAKGKLATDAALEGATSVGAEMWKLRAELTPPEVERFQELGELAASAMTETILEAARGDTEWELAAVLSGMLMADGVLPVVTLVASDERINKYRHPLPAMKEVEHYAMLVLCAKWRGLIASMTRFVAFDKLPAALEKKNQAVANVDATFILNTRPGANAGDIFARAVEVYEATGYGEEWKLHHQGGACGYAGRDWKAKPGCDFKVLPNQAYAWNPSITGTKSEDTIITGATPDSKPIVITATPELPTVKVETPWGSLERPAFYFAED